jgi:hypothetical protein
MAVENLAEKPVTKLSRMKIREISLVDDGACPEADVILMKRRVDGLVEEAIDLLKRGKGGFNPEEPRDDKGRWVHAAVDLLRQGTGHAQRVGGAIGSALHPAARQAATLLREGAAYIQHQLPIEVGGSIKSAAVALHEHAKNAANAVAAHVYSGLGTGVEAIKTTKVTAVHPVSGGGVQFSFVHGLGTAGHLQTRVQVRPEHFDQDSSSSRALKTLHGYLVSREDLGSVSPFSPGAEEDAASWFRYAHSPERLGQPQQPMTAGPGGQMQQHLPYPHAESNQHGIETYIWQGTQEPDWSKQVRSYAGPSQSTPETARGQPFVSRNNGRWIPSGRPDVQKHIVRVYDQVRSHPRGAEKVEMMARPNPTHAGGRGFFTPRKDYVPAGNEGYQWNVMRQYEQHHEQQPATGLPSHVTTPGGAGAQVPPAFAAPAGHAITSLSPAEAETLGDHISAVADKNSGQIPSSLRGLMGRSETAAQESSDMPVSQDEVNAAWRSLNDHRGAENGPGGPARRALRLHLESGQVRKRIQRIVRNKMRM